MKHVVITENEDIRTAIRDARRNVAIAKLSQFEFEAALLGGMAMRNPHRRQEIVDCLYSVAANNDLLSTHGDTVVEGMIAGGLGMQ